MATTLPRPPAAGAPVGDHADPPSPGRASSPVRPARTSGDARRAELVRLTAFLALAVFASLQWGGQVAPSGRGAQLGGVAVAAALAAALIAGRGLGAPRVRAAAFALAVVVAAAAVLLVAGVPLRLLWPPRWDELVDGIGQGLTAVPTLRVPYRGADEWIRRVVLAGGGGLCLLAAALAFGRRAGAVAGRPPLGAAAVLGVLYAVPVVARDPGRPFLSGAVLALGLAALLWGDGLGRRQLPAAAVLLLAATLAGLLLAPRVDADRPWIDPEHLADGLTPRAATTFNWDHSYDPLKWPRTGRETLRIKAPSSAYWKGSVLDSFDGLRWHHVGDSQPGTPDTEFNDLRRDWFQTIRVVVRDISSQQLYAPGEVLAIRRLGRPTTSVGGGTAVVDGRPLTKTDSYEASVYSPRPNRTDLAGAGSAYPSFLHDSLRIEVPLPGDLSRGRATVAFAPWGIEQEPIHLGPAGSRYPDGGQLLRASVYGRTYALAQRLRAQARSPYQFVRLVSQRVQKGARYTESPAPARVPLDSFLFDSMEGYCQQFSGAMALLLRMGGVPARVASGFSPGQFDSGRKEYVVRDLDAHSWVEVYFPKIGWVPFDPTPSSAPASSQASTFAVSAAGGNTGDRGGRKGADTVDDGDRSADEPDGRRPWLAAGLAVLMAALAGGGLALRNARRWPPPADPELTELERALRRTGRPAATAATLASLERDLSGSPGAQAYVRTLRDARYAGAAAGPPSRASRSALRRRLGEGLGWTGRLRAWWALPPRPPRRAAP